MRKPPLLLPALVLLALVWPQPPARRVMAQGAAPISGPVLVSSPAPFPPGCSGEVNSSGKAYPGGVVEPSVAIDPHDPSHLVGAWQQDRLSNGGALGQRSAFSRDGGKTWTASSPRYTHCQGGSAQNGGDYERASDPWVVFGANGDVFQCALLLNVSGLVSAMAVSVSQDGGTSWGDPVPFIVDDAHFHFNDKETLTADPSDPGTVYAVWDRINKADRASSLADVENLGANDTGPAMFTRTADGGRSWEPARAMYDPGPGGQTVGNQLLVLPGGVLVDAFTIVRRGRGDNSGGMLSGLASIRSIDGGRTWSDPSAIATPKSSTDEPEEPLTGVQLRDGTGQEADYAVDPQSGVLYAVWSERDLSGGKRVDLAMSTSVDGAQTWSAPVEVDLTPNDAPSFAPAVAVLPDGSVGVTYYDLRNDSPNQAAIATDYWLEICRRGCSDRANWSETHLAGPFDLRPAPYAGGLFLGDYEGLAGGPNGFSILFAQTHPSLSDRPTDIYFVAVAP